MRLSAAVRAKESYQLLVLGAGCGGSAVAARFARKLPTGQVALVDPAPVHYYQPGFTLIGGGLIPAASVLRERQSTLPSSVKWLRSGAEDIDPKRNCVTLQNGDQISYEFLVIATGLEARFDLVEGLEEGLNDPKSGVCSIYRFDLAQQTYLQLEQFSGGNAVFTFPNAPIKCPGAPQKICYMADEIFRRNNVRQNSRVIFNNTLGVIFEVPKYADALMEVINKKGIELNTRHNLVKVDVAKKIATFNVIDNARKPTDKFDEIPFNLLHVGPPCTPVESMRNLAQAGNDLVDQVGWVKVDEKSLKSTAYDNVFAFGDCANTTNKKTAAALADQLKTLTANLNAGLKGESGAPCAAYDGYASCPLVVDSRHVILSEFNHAGPLETLPLDQARPRWAFYWLTRYLLPWLYWQLHLKGRWNGPRPIRRALRLGRD